MMVPLLLLSRAFAFEPSGAADLFLPDPNGQRYFSTSSATILRSKTIVLSSDGYFWSAPLFYWNDDWKEMDFTKRSGTSLSFAFAPLEQWSVALRLPLVLGQEINQEQFRGAGGLLLQTKYGILDEQLSFLRLAFCSDLTMPSRNSEHWIGNASPTLSPSVIAEVFSSNEKIRWATEAGYYFPGDQGLFGRGYTLETAVSLQLNESIVLISEYQHYQSHQKALFSNVVGGLRYVQDIFSFQYSVGLPTNPDLSAQNVQHSLSLQFFPTWEYKSKDEDKDGIGNRSDKCTYEAEDFDGFEDEDGCPDIDNDNDGILDLQDECHLEREDFDGFEDEDGCIDIDNDMDNILDFTDRCPDKPETINGYRDLDGCPDHSTRSDVDGDRYPDNKDKCPFLAEDFDGFQDEDGCPEIDNDNDGILDDDDSSPEDPETVRESLRQRIEILKEE